jgi:arginyl-tRNA synthetase
MYKTLKTKVEQSFVNAWQRLFDDGIVKNSVARTEVFVPDRPEFGDYACNLALIQAKGAGLSAKPLAEQLTHVLRTEIPQDLYSKVEVAGPGFINVFLKPSAIHAALNDILNEGNAFGSVERRDLSKLQVEFVSSNPTGPLTVGHGRQAVLGDVLAALYKTLGYEVTREYYFNDEGRQIDLLAESLWARYRQLFGEKVAVPEDGYHGEYLIDLAREMKEVLGEPFPTFDGETAQTFKDEAISRMTACIKADLELLGVRFDAWFSEKDLHRSGEVSDALKRLHERDGTYEKEGAVRLKAAEYGGEKDAVLVRSDGRPTYLMVDIAYHINKRKRGFDHVIDVQGADHQTEQSCVKAAMRILGYPEDFLHYAVHQFVTLKETGETLRMSTRAGRFVTLRHLMEELGRDVVRYFMIARKPESHLEFDLDLARVESLDNPVHYIQYAHTRIASIFRKAEIKEIDQKTIDLSPLQARAELDLIKQLDTFPEVIETATVNFAPHLVADYALALARTFHAYYADHRVIGEEAPLMRARLALLCAVQGVFRHCLEILGMSVPERM